MVLLSILCASTPERAEMFGRLHHELTRQIEEFNKFHWSIGKCNIIIDSSRRFLDGGLSIGKKRQGLVERANGKYLCFLDSDETIAPNYVETLMRLCHEGNDIGTFRALVKLSNMWGVVNMSINNLENEQMHPDGIVQRPPWHLCPVKSVYAKMFEFPDLNNAEDFVWMEQVLKCCKTESHTDKIIFQYNHGEHSEADKIPLP